MGNRTRDMNIDLESELADNRIEGLLVVHALFLAYELMRRFIIPLFEEGNTVSLQIAFDVQLPLEDAGAE